MKNRLDLINLLEKYQKNKFVSSQYQPNENNPFTNTQNVVFLKSNAKRIRTQQDEDYQLGNYRLEIQKEAQNKNNSKLTKTANSQYYLARSECQKNLQQILNQLNKFENKIIQQQKSYIQKVEKEYQKQLLKNKKQIIDRINEIFVVQMKRQKQRILSDFKQKYVSSFNDIKDKVKNEKQQIKKLLIELNKKQYKPIIAQIVMKDFGSKLSQIQRQFQAKYFHQIKQIYTVDKIKLNCIKNDLQNLLQPNYIKDINQNISLQKRTIRPLKTFDKIVSKHQYFNQNLIDQDNNTEYQIGLKNRQMSERSVRRKSIFQIPNKRIQERSQNQRESVQSTYMKLYQNKPTKISFFNFN